MRQVLKYRLRRWNVNLELGDEFWEHFSMASVILLPSHREVIIERCELTNIRGIMQYLIEKYTNEQAIVI